MNTQGKKRKRSLIDFVDGYGVDEKQGNDDVQTCNVWRQRGVAVDWSMPCRVLIGLLIDRHVLALLSKLRMALV